MFKKALAALSVASIASFTPLNANAEEKGTYFVGAVGAGQVADIDISSALGGGEFEFDSGFTGEIGIGYDWGKVRAEFTYGSTQSDLTSIQNTSIDGLGVEVTTWMASVAYDFRADKKWQPYVGFGMGTSKVDVEAAATVGNVAVTVNDDDITSYKFKAGVNFEATDTLDVYGEIAAHALDDFTIGTLDFEDCGMSSAVIGLRIKI